MDRTETDRTVRLIGAIHYDRHGNVIGHYAIGHSRDDDGPYDYAKGEMIPGPPPPTRRASVVDAIRSEDV